MSWLNATQVISESDDESSQKKKSGVVGYLVIFDKEYAVNYGETKIGRDPSQCSIVLEHKTLSKVHAVIESEGPEDTSIYDTGSTNKTRIGKKILKQDIRYNIKDGTTIILGNVVAKFITSPEENDSSHGSQSLLSPDGGKQRERVLESPSANDSIFEASTQCRLDDVASSPDVFKTPHSVKPKYSKVSSNSDIFSAATQNCLKNNDSITSDDSDIYDQPTQCNFKTPERPRNSRFSRKLDNSDIFEMATQCQINDSIFEQETQIPGNKTDEIFEAETQCVVPVKKKLLDDSIFEAATQVPGSYKDAIFDAETQVPNGKDEFSDEDNIFDAATQVPGKNKSIFDMDTQIPCKKGRYDDDDDNIFDAATQVPSNHKNDIFDVETQKPDVTEDDNIFDMATQVSNKNDIFEAETQITRKFSEEDNIFDAATQLPGSRNNDSIFEAETQVKGFSTSSPNASNSVFEAETQVKGFSASSPNASDSVFEAETQCTVEQSKKINVSQDDSNEIIAALPDSVFEENTQVDKTKTKTPERKTRKRPLKHDNVLLFKGKRRSAEDYLNDGQDEILVEFMSQNSPGYAKKEKDAFDEDLNLEGVPNHIFEMDTQKDNSRMDSGISDEKDEGSSTQVYSPNATINDSGVKINIDEKGKEDLIPTQIYKDKTAKNSVKMVMSSSSDEDTEVGKSERALEDSIPTQIISKPSQILKQNEDDIQTQIFANEDNVPTQIFNNRVAESSDDETDSDLELPANKSSNEIDDSETDSDVEIKQSVKINDLVIDTSTSGENSRENIDVHDKSNDSFSMINEGNDSTTSLNLMSGNASLIESSGANLIPQKKTAAILPMRNLSPTQVMSEDDLFDDKNESMEEEKTSNLCFNNESKKHVCSPTQVMSDVPDSDTDCEDISIKKENAFDDTQVLPLSPPSNYEPVILNSQDAWMLGKDSESNYSTPKRNIDSRDEESTPDWGPLSLEMPSTQDFEKFEKEKSIRVSPDKPMTSKRSRESEDLETPRSKVKKENSPVFKSPKTFGRFEDHSGEVSIGPNMQQNQRPSRIKKPTWKAKSNEEDDDEDSPLILMKNKKKVNFIGDDSQDEDSPVIRIPIKKKVNVIEDDSQDENSPVIRIPNKNKPKPLIFDDDNLLSQVYEDERNISKRRSARIQKSNSNSSCNSLDFDFIYPKPKRNSRTKCKKSYFTSQVKIIFTGYENEKQFKIIENLGGEKTTDLKEANVVVTDKVRRTVKFLSAIALCLPIVGPDWLEKCSEEMVFIDPWPFLLQDKEAEDKYGFNLKGSITKAKKKKMLDGYSIFATENVKPPVHELMSIVECCGGKSLQKNPDIWPEKTIVISCPEDEKFWPDVKHRHVKIVHYEFLLTGVLKQSLDFKAFKLR